MVVSTLKKGKATFNSKEALDGIKYYGRLVGTYGPAGVTAMSWDNIMPLFQAGKLAMWTDASVFYGNIVDPAKSPGSQGERRHSQSARRPQE